MHAIASESLTWRDLPDETSTWGEILEFAQTFDGYAYWGTFERCAEVANGKAHGTVDCLRTCLFFEHRRWRNGDESAPGQRTLSYWRMLVRKLSALLRKAETSKSAPTRS